MQLHAVQSGSQQLRHQPVPGETTVPGLRRRGLLAQPCVEGLDRSRGQTEQIDRDTSTRPRPTPWNAMGLIA